MAKLSHEGTTPSITCRHNTRPPALPPARPPARPHALPPARPPALPPTLPPTLPVTLTHGLHQLHTQLLLPPADPDQCLNRHICSHT